MTTQSVNAWESYYRALKWAKDGMKADRSRSFKTLLGLSERLDFFEKNAAHGSRVIFFCWILSNVFKLQK